MSNIKSSVELTDILYERLINKDHVILNFDQSKLENGSKVGHFAILAGINLEKQTVIISDPDPKFGIFEIPISLLYEAINTIDGDSKRSRGIIILSPNPNELAAAV